MSKQLRWILRESNEIVCRLHSTQGSRRSHQIRKSRLKIKYEMMYHDIHNILEEYNKHRFSVFTSQKYWNIEKPIFRLFIIEFIFPLWGLFWHWTNISTPHFRQSIFWRIGCLLVFYLFPSRSTKKWRIILVGSVVMIFNPFPEQLIRKYVFYFLIPDLCRPHVGGRSRVERKESLLK